MYGMNLHYIEALFHYKDMASRLRSEGQILNKIAISQQPLVHLAEILTVSLFLDYIATSKVRSKH